MIIYLQEVLDVSMLKYCFCYNKRPHVILKFAGKKDSTNWFVFKEYVKIKLKYYQRAIWEEFKNTSAKKNTFGSSWQGQYLKFLFFNFLNKVFSVQTKIPYH